MLPAKKSLGQNWLTSESALKAIVAAGEIKPSDTIFEIGPGRGALTRKLLETGAEVIAIEKDDRLIADLKTQFTNPNFTLIHGDVLSFDPATLPQNYKLIANIPYYITGEILRKFLSASSQPQTMVLLVQKEVAERIVARDHKESILSLSVKVYGQPKLIKTVPRGAFSPAPKVDSAILAITNISRNQFPTLTAEQHFFETVKRGFGQKRKQLKNNLNCVSATLEQCGIPEKSRAEDLTLTTWLCLAQNLSSSPSAQ